MEGAGTEESTLIEIVCSKTNDECQTLVETYEERKYLGLLVSHFFGGGV